MPHSLKALLEGICPVLEDCVISGLSNDSRKVKSGDLFLAYPGFNLDGRSFINQAIEQGAKAICYSNEDDYYVETDNLYIIGVPNLGMHLSTIAARYYQSPSSKLHLVGITGTNGKTTSAHMLMQAYQLLGKKTGYIGTLGVGVNSQALITTNNTTPDALVLQKTLSDFVASGVSHVAMEVSSHALAQGRCDALQFRQAAFTNLSHEHLDFHENMHAYARAKAKLFMNEHLQQALINGDDSWALEMSDALNSDTELFYFGMGDNNDIFVNSYKVDLNGIYMQCKTPWGECEIQNSKVLGEFNLYNLLTVLSILCAEGFGIDEAALVISRINPVPGRMQVVASQPTVIVDYAHTPDALESVLSTLRSLTKGNISVVFGCGGDRDMDKRPLMGYIADKIADNIIITNDNPRSEDPETIAASIYEGVNQKSKATIELDREKAIQKAISSCQPEDIVVIAGKGHESYQILGNERVPFSDADSAWKLHCEYHR